MAGEGGLGGPPRKPVFCRLGDKLGVCVVQPAPGGAGWAPSACAASEQGAFNPPELSALSESDGEPGEEEWKE